MASSHGRLKSRVSWSPIPNHMHLLCFLWNWQLAPGNTLMKHSRHYSLHLQCAVRHIIYVLPFFYDLYKEIMGMCWTLELERMCWRNRMEKNNANHYWRSYCNLTPAIVFGRRPKWTCLKTTSPTIQNTYTAAETKRLMQSLGRWCPGHLCM